MSDLIDRQTVRDVLSTEWIKYVPMELDMSLAFVLGKIDELTSVTPANSVYRKKAKRWKKKYFALKTEIEKMKAEIQNMPKTYPHTDHFDDYVKVNDVLAVIEKHISGKDKDV